MNRAKTSCLSKTSRIKAFKRSRLPFVIGLVLSGQVLAGPEGEEVVGGAGNVSRSGNDTIINQATDRLAINWQSFDVNSDERVQFIQPSSSSVALNNILSNTASHIRGQVEANGQLVFVNPHGIIFGESAVVNAGGILASGLSINPSDFMNGDLTFSAMANTDGVVINSGLLNAATGGSVSLLGKQIENTGLISARLGSVNFAAGREAVVTFDNEGKVGVRITEALLESDIGVDPAVVNAGDIQAEGGKVLLTASTSQDIFSQAVNNGELAYNRSVVVNEDGSFTIGDGADITNSGAITVAGEQAGDVVIVGENITHSGEIIADSYSNSATTAGHVEIHSRDTTLLTQSSVVTANAVQGKGGDIKLLGDRVGLLSEAQVNATGASEGGQILVGGDYRGENPQVRNASAVYMGEGTQLNVNATGEGGSGGKAILWGDEALKAYGEISATGVSEGGFVETSAGVVDLDLFVDVSASLGETGTWLIDPYNITIQDGGTPVVSEDNTDLNFDSIFTAGADSSTLMIGTLEGALASGANVLVETTGSGSQHGDITLVDNLNIGGRGASSLTLRAHDDIVVNANIVDDDIEIGSDSLNLTLISNYENGGKTDAGVADPTQGNITIASGVSITTYGGTFSATGSNFTSLGHINTASATGGGNVTVNVTGDAAFDELTIGDSNASGTTDSLVSITADNVIFNDNITYGIKGSLSSHAVTLTVNAAGNISLIGVGADNSSGANIFNINLNADTDVGEAGDAADDGIVTLDGGGTLWMTEGDFSVSGHDFIMTNNATIGAEGGDISIGSSAKPLTGSVDVSAGRLSLAISGETINKGGNLYIYADEDIDLGRLYHPDQSSWNYTGSGNIELIVSAGDDLTLHQNINMDILSGTGTNSFTFLAGNSNPTDAFVADNNNVDGIHLLGELTAATDAVDLTFGSFGGDANLTHFTNEQAIQTDGGTVNISVDGDINIESGISTGGGDFLVGSEFTVNSTDYTVYANSFDNYISGSGGTIDTDGGAITIRTIVDGTANGNVVLGVLDNSTNSSAELAGDITVTSGNDITLQSEYDFDETGTDAVSVDNDPSFITFELNADNAITLNQSIVDTAVDDDDTLNLVLNAGRQTGSTTGHININAATYTGGGTISASGVDFDSAGVWIHTGYSNAGGGGNTTTSGDITLAMTGAVTLGNLRTEGGFGGGDLSITANGISSDTNSSTIEVNGSTQLNAGATGNITFDNAGHEFDGAITVVNAQDVTLANESASDGAVYVASVRDLTLSDNGVIVVGGSGGTPTISGNLNITATGILDDGAFTVNGTSSLTAGTGAIALDADHNFQSAVTVVSASQLTLRDTVGDLALGTVTITGTGDANAITATAGAVTQAATNTITITGTNSASGNLTVNAQSINLQNISTAGVNNYNGGTIILDASAGNITTGSITTNGGAADGGNAGSDAGAITLSATGAVSVGNVQAIGSDGLDNNNNGSAQYDGGHGANISITSSSGDTITLSGVSADGGNGHAQDDDNDDDANGGNAGTITVTSQASDNAFGVITLTDNVTARGGRLWDQNNSRENGNAGGITFVGNAVLDDASMADPIVIDATLTGVFIDNDGNSSGTVEYAKSADVIFSGTVDGTTVGAENLTVLGANITFTGDVGDSVRLGDVIVGEADSDVTNELGPLASEVTAADITSTSLTVTGSLFSAFTINTAGTEDVAGGSIDIAVDSTLAVGDITSAGGAATAGGLNGGAINLSATDITVGTITSAGSNAVTGTGGNGGEVTISATENDGTPSIIVNGDINTEGGAGTLAGTASIATLSLNGTGTTEGSVELNYTNFITSSFTLNGNSESGATDTLNGLPVASFWESSAAGAGEIANAAISPTTTITFTYFEALQAGDAVDTFTLNHSFSEVAGGGDADVFTVNTAITSLLLGEGGDDIFHLNAGVNDGDGSTVWDVDGGIGNDTFNVVSGLSTTTITGNTGTEDTLTLTNATGEFTWVLTDNNSGSLGNIAFTAVEKLNGSNGGDDRFEFDFSGNYGGALGGIDARDGNDSWLVTTAGVYEVTLGSSLKGMVNVETIEGGGTGYSLQLASSSAMAGTATTWDIDGVNSGTVSNGADSLAFENFAALEGNEANDAFEVASTGSIVSVSGVRSSNNADLVALENNTLQFEDASNQWLLNGLHQGVVSVGHTTSFTEIQTLTGAGADSLTARNQANTWTLNGSTNTLAADVNTPSDTVTFSGMSTLNGNDNSDEFVINASVAMMLNGGAGDDTFAFGATGAVIGAGAGINGGSETDVDTLIARDAENNWSLSSGANAIADSADAGYVSNFSGIERLEGSDTSIDNFDFADFIAFDISAGAGAGDIADYADVTGDVDIVVGAATVAGVDRFIGNNNGLNPANTNSSTLTYSSNANAAIGWAIFDFDAAANAAGADGINDGTVAGTTEFVNFNNLAGGAGNDTFTFDQAAGAVVGLSGSIAGGGNSGATGDVIVAPNVDIIWSINSAGSRFTYANGLLNADETSTNFSAIETVSSGFGDDTFNVVDAFNITLNAGDGADILNLPADDLDITLGSAINGLALRDFETVSADALYNNSLTVNSNISEVVLWDIDGENSGSVTVGVSAAVAFENFQVLIGGGGDDTFDFSGGGSVVRSETIEFGAVQGEAGNNTLISREANTQWAINGLSNEDSNGSLSVAGTAYVEAFSGIQILEGQAVFVDSFVLTDSGAFDGSINGFGGADTLSVASVSGERNDWYLNNENAGVVNRYNSSNVASSRFTFSNITALTGGTGVDEFRFTDAGSITGTINANAVSGENIGSDTVNLSELSGLVSVNLSGGTVYGVQNIEEVIGNGDGSTLIGLNTGTNTWQVNAPNDGTLVNGANSLGFFDFANLTGGADATDNFTITADGSVTGTIIGGTPTNGIVTDSIITETNSRVWALSAAGEGDVSGINFTGIERFVGNGEGDTLVGISQNNRWTVTGVNEGSVSEAGGANALAFVGMENLSGNVGSDEFILNDNAVGDDGQITGTIRGTAVGFTDAGVDTLTIASAGSDSITWALTELGGVSSASVSERVGSAVLFEQFMGGDGADLFDVNDADVSVSVDGAGSTNDRLRVNYDNPTQWAIGDAVESVAVQGRGVVTFNNIALAEGSDSASDTFNLNGAASSLRELSGRGGDDVFAVVATSEVRMTIDGGGHTDGDKLVGANRANNWLFALSADDDANTLNWNSAEGAGIDFSNIEDFTGGTGADNFEVRNANIVSTLWGASEGFTEIATDTLHVTNAATWSISGDNEGSVSSGYVSDFNSIENLTGSDSNDIFNFTAITASISGLIDGGAGTNDQLDLQVFTAGVVVELGATAIPGSIVEDASDLPNVNAWQFESITAAHKDPKNGENNNWLAIAHGDDVQWDMDVGGQNEGIVRSIESADAEPVVAIAGTDSHFYHFGSIQAGVGDEDTNLDPDSDITGEYREGSGLRSLDYSNRDGLKVVVDISPQILRLVGNDDTFLRVTEDSGFNGENTWTISGVNSGNFYSNDVDYEIEGVAATEFGFSFSGVNQLLGGGGEDTFNFVFDNAAGTSGLLVDGFINGGGGVNAIRVTSTASDLTFGVNAVQTTPTVVDVSYPQPLTQLVYLMDNREGVVDIANIASLTDTGEGTGATVVMSSGAGSTAIWTLDASNGYQLVDNSTTLSFSGVDSVAGGAANDTFNVLQLGDVSRVFDGGAGADTVNITSLTTAQHISLDIDDSAVANFVLANVETLQASANTVGHRLSGNDIGNTWNITGTNAGSVSASDGAPVLNFNNMAHLEGGDDQDVFQLGALGMVTGTVNGSGEAALPDQLLVLGSSSQSFVFQQTTLDNQNHAVDLGATQIDVYGVERLIASNAESHTLLGANNTANTWSIAALNTLVNTNGTLTFSGIDNLTGGNQQDQFSFDGNLVGGLVDGGANENNSADSVILRNIAATGISTVRLGSTVGETEINLANVEGVTSETPSDNLRLMGDNTTNIWTIQGTDAGLVNSVAFSGFADIEGGSGNDTFVLARQVGASEDDRITGSIDGGVNPDDGLATDRINLLAVEDSVTVSLDPTYTTAYLTINNIEVLEAADNNNILVGGADGTQTWTISGQDDGSLNSLLFSGFASLLGRDQIDIFNFTQSGDMSGLVNGGGQPVGTRDRVDMSELIIADVVIGDIDSGFENIEEYVGNNSSSTLTAADVRNEWTITGENTGRIQDQGGNDIAFSGFTTLLGGGVVDEFTLEAGGSLSGEIRAGAGQDRLNVNLGSGVTGGVAFYGGADDDTVFIDGGDDNNRFTATYTPASANDNENFAYSITQDEVAYNFEMELAQTEFVNNRVYTSVLTLNDVAGQEDTIVLANNRVEFTGLREFSIANNEGYSVIGEQADRVVVEGSLMLEETFSVTNASVMGADENALVVANRGVIFNATGEVGTATARLSIDTNDLSLVAVRDDVFLAQDGDLTISALSNPGGVVDIEATGSIVSGNAFNSSNALRLVSDGDILLNNNHALSGAVTLLADAGDVSLTNATTLLGDVLAQNLSLITTGSIEGEGIVQVANQTTITGADTSVVTLNNDNNRFEIVDVTNAGTFVLQDSSENGVVVSGNVVNDFSVVSPNGITVNGISADDVSLDSGAARVLIQNTINATNSVVVNGLGIDVNSAVNVTSSAADSAISLNAGSADLTIRGALLANESLAGNIELQGNAVNQMLGATIAGADVVVTSAADVALGADVSASQNLTVSAAGSIVMDGGVSPIQADAQTLSFTAGQGMVTELLSATDIRLVATNGDVIQQGDINAGGIAVIAENGSFENRSNTTSTVEAGGFTINARMVELDGTVQSSSGTFDATAADSIVIDGAISSAGVIITAGNQFGMTASGRIASSNDAVLSAGSDIQLSSVQAENGSVSLSAGGAISDNNDDQLNIVADSLIARSESGFGGLEDSATLDMSVANMDVLNASGNVGVTNNRDVTVSALITNGDIRMVNTQGNVTMANAGEDYDRAALTAREAGGVINANYASGNVTLVIEDGYLTATPGAHSNRPELVGDIIDVTTSDGFGVDRQLMVYAQTELIVSGPGIQPLWAFGEEPLFGLTTDSDLLDPSIVGSVSELLIEVDDIEYIDPAVFSNVRNFAYGGRPIRMPLDQLYDDELSDEEKDELSGL